MIDQLTISPTTSVHSALKPSITGIPLKEIEVSTGGGPAEERDMIDMLEEANEELRVLMEDDGLDEVEIVTELRNNFSCEESSDEWDDDDNSDDDSQEPSKSLASHHVDMIEEIVGDMEYDDDDNQSSDEWGDEQKISFEKVMDFIAFPEKHLFPPSEEEEGIEVDKELGVFKLDSEFGDEQQQQLRQPKEEEVKKVKETDTIELTVDTSLDDSHSEVVSVPLSEDSPPPKSSTEEETKKSAGSENGQSVEVVLPKTATPRSLSSPREWIANWFQPAGRVTVTVNKESKKGPLGVFIKKILLKDGLYISQLQDGSEVASTELKPGMKILTVNGKPCPQTVKDFRELISTMEGQVTIVAQPPEDENEGLVVVTVFKESKTQPLGLVLKRQMFREGLVVAKVLEGSIFRNTKLNEGMRIVRVNDQPCPPTVDAFRCLLQEVEGQVKIVAEPTVAQTQGEEAGETDGDEMEMEETTESEEKQEDSTTTDETQEVPTMPKIFQLHGVERKEVVCEIVKDGTHEPLGLLLREFKDEEGIHVLQLDENSKLGATALKPGMTIHQINGQECPNKVDECIELLRSIHGPLTIVASEIYED